MKNFKLPDISVLMLLVLLIMPFGVFAQGVSDHIGGLHKVLDEVYNQMIPLCSGLISAGRGIAGFGALWYIASRVWRQIAQAEAIDVYPLLRPFALGLAILFFPAVISMMNGVLGLAVSGTQGMVKDSNNAIKELLKQKELELKKSARWKFYVGEDGSGNREEWYKFYHPEDPQGQDENWLEGIGNDIRFWADRQDYKMRQGFKAFMNEVLELVYQAAALCVNTLRTFFLIVLAILGPVVLGFSVFDGLQHTLSVWIARYINIFLWLPISNIFGTILGKIQQNMIKLDISEVQATGDTLFSSMDVAYMIFMIIGILGYFSVPTVANYVVHAGGGNAILTKVNNLVTGGTSESKKGAVTAGKGALYGGGLIIDALGDGSRSMHGMAESSGSDYLKDKLSGR